MMSRSMSWILLVSILILSTQSSVNSVQTTKGKEKTVKEMVDRFGNIVTASDFWGHMTKIATGMFEDKKFQKKFRDLIATIVEEHEDLDYAPIDMNENSTISKRWGWPNPSASEKRGPKLNKWIADFGKAAKDPKYVESAGKLFMHMFGLEPFRDAFGKFLKDSKIGILDQRKDKKDKAKQKPSLTEDSDEYV